MSANSVAPGAQQKRFAAYLDRLAHAAGHLDRVVPLKSYCTGLLLPGERKSVEPMAARLCPDNVRRTHQSLHHVVAHAPWSDEDMLEAVRQYALAAMQRQGPIVAWVVDDTGLVKKGRHSVGVTRQYCGQVGKQENCRVGVSLSVSTGEASLPIAWRLYLAEVWAQDKQGRKATGVPPEIRFQTKPEIALQQIRTALERAIHAAPVLADAAYGNDTGFREGITELGLLLRSGYPVVRERGETRPGTAAQAKVERKRTSTQASAARSATCTDFRERVGPHPAAQEVERSELARRNPAPTCFAFRCPPGSSRAS